MNKFLTTLILLLALATPALAQSYSLRVKEVDGTPNQPGVRTIIVSNGTLSCSGSTCTITTGGGSGSGTVNAGTQYQFAYYPASAAAVSGTSLIATNASSQILVNGVTFNSPVGSESFSFGVKSPNGAVLEFGDFGSSNTPVLFVTNSAVSEIGFLGHFDNSSNYVMGTVSNHQVLFKQGNTTRMYLGTDGVLYFPSALGTKLQLYDSVGAGFGIQSGLMQIFAQAGVRTGIGTGSSASFTEILSVVDSQAVGINKSSSLGAALHVVSPANGTIGALVNSAAAPSVDIFDVQKNSSNVFQVTSDSVLKAGTGPTTLTDTTGKILLGALNVAPKARVYNSTNVSIPNATWTPISFDSEQEDSDAMHYTSAANLTGTVAKNGTVTLTGTGTAFLSELSVGQVISVPGTAAEKRVVTAIASDTSLTVSLAFVNTASGQTGTRVNSALVARTAGFYIISGGAEYDANGTDNRYFSIDLNDLTTGLSGTVLHQSQAPPIGGGPTSRIGGATQAQLAQWDFVEMVTYQASGGALNIIVAGGTWSPSFMMVKVSN